MDNNDGRVDLITDMPPNVIEMILTKVGIKDAVKTSTLSKIWRYRWTTISSLVFDDNCVDAQSDNKEQDFINCVTGCLSFHHGPINKFVLKSSVLENHPIIIQQWLLSISRMDIKELSIELAEHEWFTAPNSLYNCSKLTRLELAQCELHPLPSFKGFLFLKCLSLQQFLMPPGGLQKLISSCPVLETLDLHSLDKLVLIISAQNLKHLTLWGSHKEIYFENAPLLVDVSVFIFVSEDTAKNRSCKYDRFFGRIPSLERLVGQMDFTEYLSKGFEKSSMSIQHDHLKSITLYQVCFEDMNELRVLLRLLVNSPNLKELYIGVGIGQPSTDLAPDMNFWERQCPEEHMFSQLKTVDFSGISGLISEMKFIKFILERSPVLETLTTATRVDKLEAFNILKVLTKYRRASAQAELIFLEIMTL